MKILVIDGQGGGLGRQLVSALKAAFPESEIIAVGTNALATSAMLKAGAEHAATGENAVVVNCRKADIIVGASGIAIADSMYGEITPTMALAVGQSSAKRIFVPVNLCDNYIAGVPTLYEALLRLKKAEDLDLSQLEGLIKPNTKLIYVESPANPTMVLVDIAAVVEIAHKHGIKVFIDNTFATPYNTTPLDLGVDAVIHSLTKYIGGHGDLLGGAVISNDEQFLRECRLGTLMHFGSVMAPFTAFLVCRGLKTLGVRMKQYNESALKIAKWLEANPKIETVRYPFLESNPQYAIAKKQMKGGGGMISFDVAGGLEAGKKFINSLKLCTLAVSLGDTETLVEQAAAMTHTMIPKEIREAAGITDGMIRMSVGLEDPDDIIADLKQALGD